MIKTCSVLARVGFDLAESLLWAEPTWLPGQTVAGPERRILSASSVRLSMRCLESAPPERKRLR